MGMGIYKYHCVFIINNCAKIGKFCCVTLEPPEIPNFVILRNARFSAASSCTTVIPLVAPWNNSKKKLYFTFFGPQTFFEVSTTMARCIYLIFKASIISCNRESRPTIKSLFKFWLENGWMFHCFYLDHSKVVKLFWFIGIFREKLSPGESDLIVLRSATLLGIFLKIDKVKTFYFISFIYDKEEKFCWVWSL